jgi:hypothetical protein
MLVHRSLAHPDDADVAHGEVSYLFAVNLLHQTQIDAVVGDLPFALQVVAHARDAVADLPDP